MIKYRFKQRKRRLWLSFLEAGNLETKSLHLINEVWGYYAKIFKKSGKRSSNIRKYKTLWNSVIK